MKQLVERALGEEQAGFRPRRSTIDQLFTMRQILEEDRRQPEIHRFKKQSINTKWHDAMWRVMQMQEYQRN